MKEKFIHEIRLMTEAEKKQALETEELINGYVTANDLEIIEERDTVLCSSGDSWYRADYFEDIGYVYYYVDERYNKGSGRIFQDRDELFCYVITRGQSSRYGKREGRGNRVLNAIIDYFKLYDTEIVNGKSNTIEYINIGEQIICIQYTDKIRLYNMDGSLKQEITCEDAGGEIIVAFYDHYRVKDADGNKTEKYYE